VPACVRSILLCCRLFFQKHHSMLLRAAFCEDRMPSEVLVDMEESPPPPSTTAAEEDASAVVAAAAAAAAAVKVSAAVASGFEETASAAAAAAAATSNSIPLGLATTQKSVAVLAQPPEGVAPWMLQRGLELLASCPETQTSIKRSAFMQQLNHMVRGTSSEISAESTRRLLGFWASCDGGRLLHNAARSTVYTLNHDAIKQCAAAAAAALHRDGASVAFMPADHVPDRSSGARAAGPSQSASAPRRHIGDPALQPSRAIVAIMTQFCASLKVSPEHLRPDAGAPPIVGGYVTVPALASALGLDASVTKELLGALESEGVVAAPGYGGMPKHKGRAVLVSARSCQLLRGAQAHLTKSGLQVPATIAPSQAVDVSGFMFVVC
jgi:hypothetical protein